VALLNPITDLEHNSAHVHALVACTHTRELKRMALLIPCKLHLYLQLSQHEASERVAEKQTEVKLQEARDLVARLEAEYNTKQTSAAKVIHLETKACLHVQLQARVCMHLECMHA